MTAHETQSSKEEEKGAKGERAYTQPTAQRSVNQQSIQGETQAELCVEFYRWERSNKKRVSWLWADL